MESTSSVINTNQGEQGKVVESHANAPDISKYINPLTSGHFKYMQNRIEIVLNSFKNKIDEASSYVVAKGEEISFAGKEGEVAKLKPVSNYDVLKEGKKFNFLVDCLGFVHRESMQQVFDKDLFKSELDSVSDKGNAVFLMDFNYLLQCKEVIQEYLTEKTNVNLLIKLYIVEKLPLVGLLSVQKFENSQCNFENLKLLSYEIYEDNSITKPISYFLKDINKSLEYMFEMYQYQGYLQELHPGLVVKINVKENFWSENVDFTLTIVDSDDPELLKKKNCVAVIVTKAYYNDFIYIAKEGNMQLCKQVSASRLILIRPNAFNQDSVQAIKDKISHYILLFKFNDCATEAIPIMLFSDSKNEQFEIYRDNKVLIKDMEENEKKETFRQLIFFDAPNEVQSEIKLILTTKTKAKNDPDYYSPVPTISKYKEKNLVTCLDKNFICSFYIKSLLCGVFFIPTENFPKTPFNIIVLGAGIGSINHYFNRIFRENVQITSVEIDKSMPELGQKYFGFKNTGANNSNWVFGDAKDYLIKSQGANKNKFDIIISDINNTNSTDGLSPPPVFFQDDTLASVKVNKTDDINFIY